MTPFPAFRYSKFAMKGAFKHSPRVAWRKVADEAVILDTETAAYFSLDGAGLLIWELLSKKLSLEKIAAAVAAEYDAPEAVIRKDLDALLKSLKKEKLIEPA